MFTYGSLECFSSWGQQHSVPCRVAQSALAMHGIELRLLLGHAPCEQSDLTNTWIIGIGNRLGSSARAQHLWVVLTQPEVSRMI